MSKIRILPEHLANQIAAGEVIERPASVVKELLENSLDAGASRIEIEIEGSGTRLIRVIDNGEGMDEDDLLLSLERHGTSKIREDRDLAAISTLGFRGEAIPSIASVSQMTVTSRPAGSPLGSQAVINYGKLTKVHATGSVYGTQFEVRNLFGNTPARRKFLRTARTELGHIDEVVQNYALGAPEVTFILRIDGKELRHLDNSLTLAGRLGQIMSYHGTFIDIADSPTAPGSQRVFGYLIPPEKAISASARLRTFVNGRAIRDRMMAHAVAEGLRSFLMKGRNPAGLVHLVLPAGEVDVNVHPAKHEVRFRNGRDIHLYISQAVARAMQSCQQQIQSSIFGRSQMREVEQIPQENSEVYREPLSQDLDTTRQHISAELSANQCLQRQVPVSRKSQPATVTSSRYQQISLQPPATAEPVPAKQQSSSPPEPAKQTRLIDTAHTDHNLQVIGQLDNLYILCQSSEGLLIIDQHAAHERLLFEDLRRQYCSNRISSQHLLFPETIELSLFQSQLVEKYMEELEKMGFSLRHFGGNTYVISAIPGLAGRCAAGELLLDMLEQFGTEHGGVARENRFDHILATMACRAAVKAGARLSEKEIEALLDRMAKADLFSHCPHGRPVWKNISRTEIQKWFYRTS